MKIFLFLILNISVSWAVEVGDNISSDLTVETLFSNQEKIVKSNLLARQSLFLVIEVMSSDCRTCIASMPSMNQLAQEIMSIATIKTVAIDRNLELDGYFFNTYFDLILYPFIFDSNRAVARLFEVRYTPSVFILNAENEVIYKHEGEVTPAEVAQMVTFLSKH